MTTNGFTLTPYGVQALRFQHAAKVKRLEDKIKELEESKRIVEIALEQEQRNKEFAVRQAYREATDERNDHFTERVISFEQGCNAGKVEFLNYCGLEIPRREESYVVTLSVPDIGEDSRRYWIQDNLPSYDDEADPYVVGITRYE